MKSSASSQLMQREICAEAVSLRVHRPASASSITLLRNGVLFSSRGTHSSCVSRRKLRTFSHRF
jgi:hypothetical protein